MTDAASLVATLRDRVDAAEADWRRRRLPPPTRDRPRPDPAALHGARTLEAAARELDAIAAQLRAAPSAGPATAEADAALRDHAGFLLSLLDGAPDDAAPLLPDQLAREVSVLRELAGRRISGSSSG